eukprot:90962-Amphidinium_carterae.1
MVKSEARAESRNSKSLGRQRSKHGKTVLVVEDDAVERHSSPDSSSERTSRKAKKRAENKARKKMREQASTLSADATLDQMLRQPGDRSRMQQLTDAHDQSLSPSHPSTLLVTDGEAEGSSQHVTAAVVPSQMPVSYGPSSHGSGVRMERHSATAHAELVTKGDMEAMHHQLAAMLQATIAPQLKTMAGTLQDLQSRVVQLEGQSRLASMPGQGKGYPSKGAGEPNPACPQDMPAPSTPLVSGVSTSAMARSPGGKAFGKSPVGKGRGKAS